MSPSILLELRAGFNDRLQEMGHEFQLVRTGQHWDAILMPVNPIDPTMELGSDWRELATLESRREDIPDILYGDVILQVRPFWSVERNPPSQKWKVVRRSDNPANFAIKFWLVKVTDQDADG